jgi:peptidoglycan hydrolase CwlO-like protein
MKKTLKTIYAAIAGIVTVIITFFLIKNKTSNKKIDKTDKQIADNKSTADNAQGHIEAIEEQKEEVTDSIKNREQVIEDLKQDKETIQPETTTDIKEAKENIINKTKRRGRKPRKKS